MSVGKHRLPESTSLPCVGFVETASGQKLVTAIC